MIVKIYRHNELEKMVDVFNLNRFLMGFGGGGELVDNGTFDIFYLFTSIDEATDCFGAGNIPAGLAQYLNTGCAAVIHIESKRGDRNIVIDSLNADEITEKLRAAFRDFCDIDFEIQK